MNDLIAIVLTFAVGLVAGWLLIPQPDALFKWYGNDPKKRKIVIITLAVLTVIALLLAWSQGGAAEPAV